LAVLLGRFYLLAFAVWLALRNAFGDGVWWLYILNVGTDYALALLPFAVFLALAARKPRWIAAGATLAVAVVLVGNVRLPAPPARAANPSLKVMTFNVSADTRTPETVISAIRHADPDVACFQELDRQKARAIDRELAETYPHRLLEPHPNGYAGMGIISRYPIRPVEQELAEPAWIGPPQIATLDWAGTELTLVNIHAIHALSSRPPVQEQLNAVRLRNAGAVVDFARGQARPVVLCADFNATPHSDVYSRLTSALVDSWREAGIGPGYSWNALPVALGAFRIDYVMHSRELRAVDASLEPWDGASDHRPVSARLVLIL
jgi:vancomycin resistance protein VanJ